MRTFLPIPPQIFEDKVDVSDSLYDQNAEMLLLSQALQQACAAFLYVFWEWKPSHYDLDFLLNLCSLFSQSQEILFPKKSFRSHKVYHALLPFAEMHFIDEVVSLLHERGETDVHSGRGL